MKIGNPSTSHLSQKVSDRWIMGIV